MDRVCERVRDLRRSAGDPDVPERLRDIGCGHTEIVFVAEGSAACFFEFIAAPPGEGVPEVLAQREFMLVQELAGIVVEGQAQEIMRKEVEITDR